MNDVLISVIIPVYNLEHRNLSRCLDSIIKQSYTNYEVLMINDGSTDNSRGVCEKYVSLDKRFKLSNKPNGGVSSARNMGIEYCQGEYIAFIDGDDYVDYDYLEHFARMLPADLILQSVTDFCYDYDKAKTQYHFQDKNYGDNFYELFSEYNLYNFGAPWARIFKTSIIRENRLRFDTNLQYREDELFFLAYLKFCKVVKTGSYSGYHYIYYPTSAKSKRHKFEHNYEVATKIYTTSIELGKRMSFDEAFFNTISFKCISSLFVSLSSMYKEQYSVN